MAKFCSFKNLNIYICVCVYLWASLVAQMVKNPPAMWETWVWSLSWEDPLGKGKATHSSTGPGELQRVWQDWAAFTFTFGYVYILNPWLTAKDIVFLINLFIVYIRCSPLMVEKNCLICNKSHMVLRSYIFQHCDNLNFLLWEFRNCIIKTLSINRTYIGHWK